MTPLGIALNDALDRPEEWLFPDTYKIIHKPSGMFFWIANGAWFFDCYGTPSLGFFERHVLWRKYKRMANVAGAMLMTHN